jgi:hypothetical protein
MELHHQSAQYGAENLNKLFLDKALVDASQARHASGCGYWRVRSKLTSKKIEEVIVTAHPLGRPCLVLSPHRT